MDFIISTYINGTRPKVTMPDKEILNHLGEKGIRKIVDEHYNLLVKSEISDIFPQNSKMLEIAKLKSSDFFIQILGGHPYYKENQGAPMMSKRHAPFKITPEARIVWLSCYQEIFKNLALPEHLVQSYWNYLDKFSMWMVNTIEVNKQKVYNISL